jgi:hypothetical protein
VNQASDGEEKGRQEWGSKGGTLSPRLPGTYGRLDILLARLLGGEDEDCGRGRAPQASRRVLHAGGEEDDLGWGGMRWTVSLRPPGVGGILDAPQAQAPEYRLGPRVDGQRVVGLRGRQG